MVDRLLKAKSDVNARAASRSGRIALQGAAEQEHSEVVKRLLRAGADVKGKAAGEDGLTALEAARKNGDETLLKLYRSAPKAFVR